MNSNTLYIGREWNVDHDHRVKVRNAELRYAVLGRGEPVLCIHGTSIADSLSTRTMEPYSVGDKLGAAQRYMEAVCGPRFLSSVEMTEPLDIWKQVEGLRRHDVHGRPSCACLVGTPDGGEQARACPC